MGRRRIAAALLLLCVAAAGCSGTAHDARTSASSTRSAGTPASIVVPPLSTPTPTPTAEPKRGAETSSRAPTHAPSPEAHVSKADAPPARTLPLAYSTGSAGQVITVTAQSGASTTATLQAWRRVTGGWRTVGGSVLAHLGTAGLGVPSESSTATPTGSFTLTQAFGHFSNPGTSLPYVHTTPADWWISQSGPLYNTRQHCSAGCSFTRGDPNEHLYYETPYYNYAVVIDYNTRNAPGGVQAGKGSAFFLHVTVGEPTQGCVSIPADQLVRLLRWLTPAQHPRILLGVG